MPLVRALGGPVAPDAWRGGLHITYHLGPGPATVRLRVAFDWSLAPARDVIAFLRGSEKPDQWVIRGNHHDAWVNGANDPVSGLVPLLAEPRALRRLPRHGSRARKAGRRRAATPAWAWPAWAPGPTPRRSSSISASPPWISASGAKTAAAPITRSTTPSTTTRGSVAPASATGSPSRSPRAVWF